MAVTQAASFREISSAPVLTVSAGGSLSAGSINFKLYYQNRVGLNYGSAAVAATLASGDQIALQIPGDARRSGEEIEAFVIGASLTSDPTTFVQIAKVQGRQVGGAFISLPTSINLTRDAHLALSASVADPSALPTGSDRINGMRRRVNSLAEVFEYDATSLLTADGTTVLAADVGRWILANGFSTYVGSITGDGGSDQVVETIDPATIDPLIYAVDRSAGPVTTLWYRNGYSEDNGTSIEVGARLGLKVFVDGALASQQFDGKLKIIFRGYARPLEGTLDATLDGVGSEVTYTYAKTDQMALPAALPPGHAAVYSIYPLVDANEFDPPLEDNSVISVSIRQYGQAGAYTEIGAITGDFIAADKDRRRIVPDVGLIAKALAGSGIVDSHRFVKGESTVIDLLPNTADQIITINANGAVFALPPASLIDDTEAIRALLGTVAGVSSPSAQTAYAFAALNSRLTITLNHPTNGTVGTVRADYPDVIAGTAKGQFNPLNVVIYIQQQSTGETRRFDGVLALDAPTQAVEITDWTAGTVIPSIPAAPSPDFSLYAPGAASFTVDTTGTFPADSYRVSFAYAYDGNQITAISHSTANGCLYESDASLAEVMDRAKYWAQAVVSSADLRSVALANITAYQTRTVATGPTGPQQWQFLPDATEADDGVQVLKPSAIAADQPGRWKVVNRGPAPTIGIGTVTVVDDPAAMSATISGTADNLLLNLTLASGPQGEQGEPGIGIPGPQGEPGFTDPKDVILQTLMYG